MERLAAPYFSQKAKAWLPGLPFPGSSLHQSGKCDIVGLEVP
jgi:hypothetical protein